MPKTQLILAVIFRDYLSTPTQKEKIKNFEKLQLQKLDKEARKKYNPHNIFKNTSISYIENNEIRKETNLVTLPKETLLNKILNKIKDIFNIKKF